MRTESQHRYLKMAAKIPKNVRFRPDQILDLDAELELIDDKEKDFSKLVRIAVDELLARRRRSRIAEEAEYRAVVKPKRKSA